MSIIILDDVRFQQTIMGERLVKPKQGILNNRRQFSRQIESVSPMSGQYVLPGNTGTATLYLTKAFAAPGVMFMTPITTNRSYCLTYFQWGNGLWAREVPEE